MPLLRFRRNGKYGYCDPDGRVLIEPRFTDADDFSGSLAAACVGGQPGANGIVGGAWGFIDKAGRCAIEPTLDYAGPFVDGLAPARPRGGHFGFIDDAGKWAIPPQYSTASPFQGDVAPVGFGNDLGYIDRAGKRVI